ncbi:MAG TPA: AAA family ATPase [Caulobacteraceae bacterium]|jgi:predicted ATPase|nr:AAA family ATPase [Caulobacteraceae bacterium]HEX4097648.1 AAA family ATPase [Caulobacteraceae bacterium]
MQRFILTGAPGAGKTIILRQLELDGFAVVEEAATDLIALVTAQGVERHWELPTFIDDILALQQARQRRADVWPETRVVFDRSPICTWALCRFVGREPPEALVDEAARIQREGVYERRVFFVENLGFVTPTEARRISFEDTVRFEAIHRDVYREFGFNLISVPPGEVGARTELVKREMARA